MRVIHRVLFVVALGTCFASITGCGGSKVRFEKTEEINNEAKSYIIDAPTKDQKVRIEVTADEPFELRVQLDGATDSERMP